jgi:hemerythrin-like metal-binding protein
MNTNLLEWSENLHIGVGELDAGHEELVDLYNRIVWVCENDLRRSSVCERLRSFLAYAGHHFQEEEKFMLAMHYPEYVAHKAEHDRLLQDSEDFIDNFKDFLGLEDGDAIVKYFKYWLLRHIVTNDSKLREFCAASVDRKPC